MADNIDSVIEGIVEQIWETYDRNNSGKLDRDETKQFLLAVQSNMSDGRESAFSDDDFEECFSAFDRDGSGTVEKNEMVQFIK